MTRIMCAFAGVATDRARAVGRAEVPTSDSARKRVSNRFCNFTRGQTNSLSLWERVNGEGLALRNSVPHPNPLPEGEGVKRLRLRLRAFRVNYFSGLESDLTVRAVTKRLVRRSAAAAQSDAWAIVGGELISRRVVNINWTFDQIGTIRFRTDRYLCHFSLLMI